MESLNQLSLPDIQFVGQVLEDIYIHQKIDLPLQSPAHVTAMANVITAVPNGPLKHQLFANLDEAAQLAVLKAFHKDARIDFFIEYPNFIFLRLAFDQLSEVEQKQITQALYTKAPDRYPLFSQSGQPKVTQLGKLNIQKIQTTDEILEIERDRILETCGQPEKSIDMVTDMGKRLLSKYEINEVDQLVQMLIRAYPNHYPKVSSQPEFATLLRFVSLLSPMAEVLPETPNRCQELVPLILNFLPTLPSTEWIFKILNQFPLFFVGLVINQVKSHDQFKSFEKRQLYSKMYKALVEFPQKDTYTFVSHWLSELN